MIEIKFWNIVDDLKKINTRPNRFTNNCCKLGASLIRTMVITIVMPLTMTIAMLTVSHWQCD